MFHQRDDKMDCLMYPNRPCLQDHCGFAGGVANCWVLSTAHCPKCHELWNQHNLDICKELEA